MYPILLHIYGPFAIHSYGVMIALGITVFSWCILRDPRRKNLLSEDMFISILMRGIIIATVGGKILFTLHNWHEFDSLWQTLEFWNGGFSVLGSIAAIILIIPLYLKWYKIPMLPFLDLVALHTPLLHSISRIGCLFAACCYGIPTNLPWAIPIEGQALLRHPTQLYSSIALLGIFLLLYLVIQHHTKKPGQLMCWYLLLTCAERFLVDSLRADQSFADYPFLNIFSLNQWMAILIALGAGTFFHHLTRSSRRESIQFH